MKKIQCSLCFVAMLLASAPNASAQTQPLHSFQNTTITSGRMKMLEQKDVEVIKSLDTDRLLFRFRELAGIDNPGDKIQVPGNWQMQGPTIIRM